MFRPLEAGALLRLSLRGGPLSVALSHPAGGAWAAGAGIAAEGEGEIIWQDGAAPGCPGPWFGGWSFDGVERWVLPRALAWWDGGKTWVAAFGDDAAQTLDEVTEAEPVTSAPVVKLRPPDRAGWTRRVEAALDALNAGRLSKVVLARQLEVEADQPFEVRRILKALEARFPTCWTFLQQTPAGAFVGATPEMLCRVQGRALTTEAVAGTGRGEELLDSSKDRREHAWVVEGIVDALRPLSAAVDVGPLGLKRLPNLSHLCTPIHATLRDGVDPLEAARALHPTPAVGGTPRAAALAFLGAHEGFDRGGYAGAVGTRGPQGLQLYVGIRSALISGCKATVYAGAGIVAGSTADGEWAETQRKASALLTALGVES